MNSSVLDLLPTPLKKTQSVDSTVSSRSALIRKLKQEDGQCWPSIGSKKRREESDAELEERLAKLSSSVEGLLLHIGEDPTREGLVKTPLRYAKALMDFTNGYEVNLEEIVNGAVFDEDHDEMVLVRDIDIFSLCEHHLVPFFGKVHIAYIPKGKVIGLSKLARIAEVFSRRLSVQERLTKQIALALEDTLDPIGVAVVIEATHMCMVMRGVGKVGASTVTSCMLGGFRDDPKTRDEFLRLIGK
ncbi:GTP cyclohydrolase I [Lobulomyces angularis]|nr:GTP cyclohydrolase I [Lobulomyces angularis]